jgi:hypothetical protein
MKFQYDLEPSAEVEVYRDGTWLPGVISEIGSCESSKYAVRVKKHNNADEEDYTLVSSAFLRPCCKWDGQQWRLSSTKAFHQLHKVSCDLALFFLLFLDHSVFDRLHGCKFTVC